MDSIKQWVFAATINYEKALINALATLDEADKDDRLAALEGLADALAPFKAMTDDDRQDALRSLLRRGSISEHEWDRIAGAMQCIANRQPAH